MIRNGAEILKATMLTGTWWAIIFGLVWIACWVVGIVLPGLLSGMEGDTPRFWAEICRALTPILAVMVFIPVNAMFMVLIERRALALFTVRKGPNRVGPDGYLQTFADALKLLFKEDITPRGADAVMFTLAPIIFFAPSIFGAMPLLAAVTNNHELFQVMNLPTGIFFVLAASSVPVVGIVMGGWASNNKYSLVGGLRSAAQAISYEIPLVLSIVTICLLAGTLDVVQIAKQQAGGILNWNLLGGGALRGLDQAVASGADALKTFYYAPAAAIVGTGSDVLPWILSSIATVALVVCTVTAFCLYLTGACAEINRIPFDLPEAESELVSGYNTEYSGIKFAIFFLAEFTNLFIVASIATVMFLGGGDCPVPAWLGERVESMLGIKFSSIVNMALAPLISVKLIDPATMFAAVWVILKTYTIVFFAILVRGTLPRFRIDQLMDFGWKRLIPLSLIVFLVVVFAREFVVCHVGT
ncbi:MAG TPA: complex I subunit 1 family protein [Candidatus Obscuribacterales bacterium]